MFALVAPLPFTTYTGADAVFVLRFMAAGSAIWLAGMLVILLAPRLGRLRRWIRRHFTNDGRAIGRRLQESAR